MGQSASSLLGPDLESSSDATRTGRHHTRQHREYSHSKRSTFSSPKNDHLGSRPVSSRTQISTHHDQAERAERHRAYRDPKSKPLTETDGNAQQSTASAWSIEHRRRKPHAKPQEPKPRDNGSASKPRRTLNRKVEPHGGEKTANDVKPRSHAHTPPPPSNNHRRDSKHKSGANVKVTELHRPKAKLQRNIKPEKKATKDCMVCVETRSIGHFPQRAITAQCTHELNTCRHCLRGWIRSEFKAKVWNQLGCPECKATMEYEDVKEFAPAEVFKRYDRLSTKAALEAIPGFRWCISKNCKSGQVHDEGDTTAKFRCVGCKKSHCIVHQVAWHKEETCAEYDYRTNSTIKNAEESASKKLIKELAKQCPGCEWNIEKNDGCDHMTCTKCRHEFCWLCLAPWIPIREQGAHMHLPTCGMHSGR